jgi:hypothetical protein
MAVSAHVGIKKNIRLFRLLRPRAGRGRSLTASKARKHFDLQPATGCRPRLGHRDRPSCNTKLRGSSTTTRAARTLLWRHALCQHVDRGRISRCRESASASRPHAGKEFGRRIGIGGQAVFELHGLDRHGLDRHGLTLEVGEPFIVWPAGAARLAPHRPRSCLRAKEQKQLFCGRAFQIPVQNLFAGPI